SIIADYYAFGARGFDTATALKDMLAQATTVNDVRPGEALEAKYGYLPENGTYGCCNPHGYVPTLLEYDSQDLALSLFARSLGGKAAVVPALREFLSQPDASGMHALLTNEFGFGEQYALNYAQDPAGTQQAVNHIRNTMYAPGPSGLADNDDLGANSSAFVWEMLGMYPENSGSDT